MIVAVIVIVALSIVVRILSEKTWARRWTTTMRSPASWTVLPATCILSRQSRSYRPPWLTTQSCWSARPRSTIWSVVVVVAVLVAVVAAVVVVVVVVSRFPHFAVDRLVRRTVTAPLAVATVLPVTAPAPAAKTPKTPLTAEVPVVATIDPTPTQNPSTWTGARTICWRKRTDDWMTT